MEKKLSKKRKREIIVGDNKKALGFGISSVVFAKSKIKKAAQKIKASRCRKDDIRKIKNLDVHVISFYKTNSYYIFNKVARQSNPSDEDVRELIRLFFRHLQHLGVLGPKIHVSDIEILDVIFLKKFIEYLLFRMVANARCTKTTKKLVLYRGEKPYGFVPAMSKKKKLDEKERKKLTNQKYKEMKKGNVIVDAAPISVSASQEIARTFFDDGGFFFTFEVPKGTPILSVMRYDPEPEYVFPPGTRYRVNARHKNKYEDKTEIYATILPTRSFLNYIPDEDIENFASSLVVKHPDEYVYSNFQYKHKWAPTAILTLPLNTREPHFENDAKFYRDYEKWHETLKEGFSEEEDDEDEDEDEDEEE
jgi:hypothetical protein